MHKHMDIIGTGSRRSRIRYQHVWNGWEYRVVAGEDKSVSVTLLCRKVVLRSSLLTFRVVELAIGVSMQSVLSRMGTGQ